MVDSIMFMEVNGPIFKLGSSFIVKENRMIGSKYWANLLEQEAAKLAKPLTKQAMTALTECAGMPGCYGFKLEDDWIYIGRTSRFPARVLKSAKDRVDGEPVTLVLMPAKTQADSWHQELALIHKYRPSLNKAGMAEDQTTFTIPLPEITYEVQLFEF